MTEEIDELFGYIGCGLRDSNSRIKNRCMRKLAIMFDLNEENDVIDFLIKNYDKFPKLIQIKTFDIFRAAAMLGNDKGMKFIKNHNDKKLLEEIKQLDQTKQEKIQKFITEISEFECSAKYIESYQLIEIEKKLNDKDLYRFRESDDIVNYVTAKEYVDRNSCLKEYGPGMVFCDGREITDEDSCQKVAKEKLSTSRFIEKEVK